MTVWTKQVGMIGTGIVLALLACGCFTAYPIRSEVETVLTFVDDGVESAKTVAIDTVEYEFCMWSGNIRGERVWCRMGTPFLPEMTKENQNPDFIRSELTTLVRNEFINSINLRGKEINGNSKEADLRIDVKLLTVFDSWSDDIRTRGFLTLGIVPGKRSTIFNHVFVAVKDNQGKTLGTIAKTGSLSMWYSIVFAFHGKGDEQYDYWRLITDQYREILDAVFSDLEGKVGRTMGR